MITTHSKRPDDALIVGFDFRKFAEGLAPGATIDFNLHGEEGVTLEATPLADNVFSIKVSGGRVGRSYSFGIEARSTDGRSEVQHHRIRIKQPFRWAGVPVYVDNSPGDGNVYLADGYGNLLIDLFGRAIYAPDYSDGGGTNANIYAISGSGELFVDAMGRAYFMPPAGGGNGGGETFVYLVDEFGALVTDDSSNVLYAG